MVELSNKRFWAVAIGAAALSLGWILRAPAQASSVAPAPSEISRELIAPGAVQAANDPAALSFEAQGRVAEVLVEEGQLVRANEVLARLDTRLAKASLLRAEANLAASKARRDALLHGSRPEEIREAEAQAETARAHSRDADRRRTRTEKLFQTRIVSEAEFDDANESANAARAQLDAAEAHLTLINRGARAEARQEAIAAVAAAEAELEEARAVIAQHELRAPIDGVVLRRNVEVGERVVTTPPKTLLTLVDRSKLEIRAEIDEADIGRVRVGQAGFATAAAFGDKTFSGHVVKIQGELGRKAIRVDDPRARVDTRILEVRFALDAPAELPIGLRMDLHLNER
jgi:multidrug resistance efflux pump